MNKAMMLLTVAALLSACGGTTVPGTDPDPGTGGDTFISNPNPNAAVIKVQQILGCPAVSVSPDMAAGNCLKGKLVGKTLSGGACTVYFGDQGDYYYESAELSYGVKNKSSQQNSFSYSANSFIIWNMGGSSSGLRLELDLDNMNTAPVYTFQVDATKGTTSSTCKGSGN